MSLSSLIVQREVASIRQVEEALARQVLYGGDLVTNLLEVVQLPEAILVPLLAESLGIPPAPIGPLPTPGAEALALVPEDVATRRVVVPLSVDGERLVLAVSEPLGPDVVDELSFALGRQIIERIAPSVRIREALARAYGVPLDRRMARLVGRLAGVDPTGPNSLPPLAPHQHVAVLTRRATSDVPPALTPPGTPSLDSLLIPDDATLASQQAPMVPLEAEPDRPKEGSMRPPRMPDGAFLQSMQREVKVETARRRRGPLTLQSATAEVSAATDRDTLLQLFFDFARQFFEYSALFVVHGDLAEGRDAHGAGATRERVLALGVPLDHASILATARDRGVPVCAVPSTSGLDAVLLGDLRRTVRAEVLVVPIVVRTRTVALLVADDGAEGINPTAQGEVATLAALVGREFERIIVRNKLAGFSGDKRPESRRAVDPGRVAAKRSVHPPAAPPAPVEEVTAPPPEVDEITEKPPIVEPTPVLILEPETSTRPGSRPPLPTMPGPLAELSPEPAAVVSILTEGEVDAPDQDLPPEDGWASADDDGRPGALRPDTVFGVIEMRPRYKTLQSFPMAEMAAAHGFEPTVPLDDDADAPLSDDLRPHEPAELSDRPPPPQTAAVRHPSGPPIPREDPDELGRGSGAHRVDVTSDRPPPLDERQEHLLREIDALAEKFAREAAPVSRPPVSSQSVALPSVIVDVASDYDALAQRFVDNPNDEMAEAELLRLGQHAMPAIMKQFPGPLTVPRDSFDEIWPRVTECGPVLRLIAGQRRVALPFVVARTEDPDPESRFWATYLISELAYPDAVPAVVARLFDDAKRTRRAARLAALALAHSAGGPLVAELDRIVRDPNATSQKRVATVDTLGELRDPIVAPVLLGAMSDVDEDVALAARRALVLVTRQDFGRDTRKWLTWWGTSSSRHRIEWLIDALTHETPALRRAAGQELKALSEEYFGYYDDLPKKERERAQQRYRDWWKTEGHARFRRS
jgi:HEAT repeat protein